MCAIVIKRQEPYNSTGKHSNGDIYGSNYPTSKYCITYLCTHTQARRIACYVS